MKTSPSILGIGSGYPSNTVESETIDSQISRNRGWTFKATGIGQRRIHTSSDSLTEVSANACLQALEMANIERGAIDLVIACTSSHDSLMPGLGCSVQAKLNLSNYCGAYDISSACSGWLIGIETAKALVESKKYKYILVIGADFFSRHTDPLDKNTATIFGDGAGAALVGLPSKDSPPFFIINDTMIQSDGKISDELKLIPTPAGKHPQKSVNNNGYLSMDGEKVFMHSIRGMTLSCLELCNKNGVDISRINVFVPHQANKRIMTEVAENLEIPEEKIICNVHKFGNTVAATLPTALHYGLLAGNIKLEDLILLTTFGAGITWGSMLLRYSRN